jgi:hypothetical protein
VVKAESQIAGSDVRRRSESINKIHITGALFRNALLSVESANAAHDNGWLDAEVQHSLAAHLMCALALEGIINEVGESVLSSWAWERTEKIDTSFKWLVVSKFLDGAPFEPGREPLGTVVDLQSVRNRIAHPKSFPPGDEVMVRHQDGSATRDAQPGYVLQEGDTVFAGFGKLLVEFNASSAQRFAIRTNAAFRALKEKVKGNLIDWVKDFESQYSWLKTDNKTGRR